MTSHMTTHSPSRGGHQQTSLPAATQLRGAPRCRHNPVKPQAQARPGPGRPAAGPHRAHLQPGGPATPTATPARPAPGPAAPRPRPAPSLPASSAPASPRGALPASGPASRKGAVRAGLTGACSRYGLTGSRLLRFAGICSSRPAGPPAGAEGRGGQGALRLGGERGRYSPESPG